MNSMKVKLLAVVGTVASVAGMAHASAYVPDYTTTDFVAIIVDILGTAGVFIKDNITLIGIILLVGFITAAWAKTSHKLGF